MSVTQAIEALQSKVSSSSTLLPDSAPYRERIASYYSILIGETKPAGIFRAKNATDVATFVKTVKPFVDQGVKLAIRGAGQQPTPNCSSIENGITLDLVDLNDIEIDEQSGTVRLGAGARWEDIYSKVQERGLGVTGSRSAKGGVGGLALAGGLSFFSSREGFICDNVVNYEVVLASGKIVNANSKENTDLWKALRGGGNNLGVVTRFDIRTFPQGPFWGGSVFYFPDKYHDQIDVLVNELTTPNANKETHIMQTIGYAEQFAMTFCMNQVYYTREKEQPEELKQFTNIQPQIDQMNTLKMKTLVEAAEEQARDSRPGVRTSYFNLTVKADAETLKSAADIFIKEIEPIKSVAGIVAGLTFQAYPVSLLEKSVENGGNSLGLSPSDGPLVSILFLNFWQKAEDDKAVISTVEGTLAKIKSDAQAKATLVPFTYLNYSWSSQDPISSYGEEQVVKLREVSQKYDPNGVFQKGVPGGFKLFA